MITSLGKSSTGVGTGRPAVEVIVGFGCLLRGIDFPGTTRSILNSLNTLSINLVNTMSPWGIENRTCVELWACSMDRLRSLEWSLLIFSNLSVFLRLLSSSRMLDSGLFGLLR